MKSDQLLFRNQLKKLNCRRNTGSNVFAVINITTKMNQLIINSYLRLFNKFTEFVM